MTFLVDCIFITGIGITHWLSAEYHCAGPRPKALRLYQPHGNASGPLPFPASSEDGDNCLSMPSSSRPLQMSRASLARYSSFLPSLRQDNIPSKESRHSSKQTALLWPISEVCAGARHSYRQPPAAAAAAAASSTPIIRSRYDSVPTYLPNRDSLLHAYQMCKILSCATPIILGVVLGCFGAFSAERRPVVLLALQDAEITYRSPYSARFHRFLARGGGRIDRHRLLLLLSMHLLWGTA